MRDRNLTGPWAGFSFKGGRLVTPEGRELLPEDLAWLSLTACLAQEWRSMMAEARARGGQVQGVPKPLQHKDSKIVVLREHLARPEKERLSPGGPDAGAAASNVVQIRRGPQRPVRG